MFNMFIKLSFQISFLRKTCFLLFFCRENVKYSCGQEEATAEQLGCHGDGVSQARLHHCGFLQWNGNRLHPSVKLCMHMYPSPDGYSRMLLQLKELVVLFFLPL